MNLVPRRGYGFDLFDDLFEMPVFKTINTREFMKTDIHETADSYRMEIDLPGFAKEDMHIELEKGYLTVRAEKNTNQEEKDEKGNIIHKERYSGKCSRTFFVGNDVTEEEIKAAYQNGILTLTLPKETKKIEQKRYINID